MILCLFFVNIFTLPIDSGREVSVGSGHLSVSGSKTPKISEIAVSRFGFKKETSAKAFLKGTVRNPYNNGGFFTHGIFSLNSFYYSMTNNLPI